MRKERFSNIYIDISTRTHTYTLKVFLSRAAEATKKLPRLVNPDTRIIH
jgi:hypothetical protein